jgi:hypothetical protein
MANERYRLLSRILVGMSAVMALISLYFLFVANDMVIGGVLLAVAMSDLVMAFVFSRRA